MPDRTRALLVASLVLNVLFVAAAAPRVVRRLRPHRDYASIYRGHRISLFGELAAGKADVVLLGASLVDGAEWSELLGMPGVVNRGIAGDSTQDVLGRIDQVVRLGPRVVAIMVGTNDLIQQRPPDDIVADYDRLLDALFAASPRPRVVVQAVLPVNTELCEEPITNERIAALNARLRALAERRGARFLDANPALADVRGQLDRRLTLDGVHVTGEGYRRWAEALRPLLAAP